MRMTEDADVPESHSAQRHPRNQHSQPCLLALPSFCRFGPAVLLDHVFPVISFLQCDFVKKRGEESPPLPEDSNREPIRI